MWMESWLLSVEHRANLKKENKGRAENDQCTSLRDTAFSSRPIRCFFSWRKLLHYKFICWSESTYFFSRLHSKRRFSFYITLQRIQVLNIFLSPSPCVCISNLRPLCFSLITMIIIIQYNNAPTTVPTRCSAKVINVFYKVTTKASFSSGTFFQENVLLKQPQLPGIHLSSSRASTLQISSWNPMWSQLPQRPLTAFCIRTEG